MYKVNIKNRMHIPKLIVEKLTRMEKKNLKQRKRNKKKIKLNKKDKYENRN